MENKSNFFQLCNQTKLCKLNVASTLTKARSLIMQKFSISEYFLMDSSMRKVSANNVLHKCRLMASIFLMKML